VKAFNQPECVHRIVEVVIDSIGGIQVFQADGVDLTGIIKK